MMKKVYAFGKEHQYTPDQVFTKIGEGNKEVR